MLFNQPGGGRQIRTYPGTMEDLLREAYPEYPWDSLQFVMSRAAPPGFLKDKERVKKCLCRIENELGITQVVSRFPSSSFILLFCSRRIGIP